MPVLVNKTQKNFTMISNNILRDKELCLKDRGLLCTLCSLPDKWNFSIAGLCAIVPDGKESITNSLNRLEQLGYLIRSTHRDSSGKFVTEIEVFAERRTIAALPERETGYGTSVTGVPERANRLGSPDAENPLEYKTDHKKGKGKKDHIKSIRSDEHNACDGGTEPEFQSHAEQSGGSTPQGCAPVVNNNPIFIQQNGDGNMVIPNYGTITINKK